MRVSCTRVYRYRAGTWYLPVSNKACNIPRGARSSHTRSHFSQTNNHAMPSKKRSNEGEAGSASSPPLKRQKIVCFVIQFRLERRGGGTSCTTQTKIAIGRKRNCKINRTSSSGSTFAGRKCKIARRDPAFERRQPTITRVEWEHSRKHERRHDSVWDIMERQDHRH